MNQCFLLIQQATRVFANDEVSPSFYYISPRFFLTHMRLQHFTLQNSISNLLRPSDDSWNIAREIVHLLWAYGQDSHSLRKSDLKYWNGTAFYNSFFKLDPEAKGFQVGLFLVNHALLWLLLVSSELSISTFVSTTTFSRSGSG